MEVTKISEEAIQKALTVLGLSKASDNDSDDNEDEDKEKEMAKAKADEEIKKAADAEKFKADYADVVKKAEEMKKQAIELNIDLDSSKMGDPQGGETTAITAPIVKAESTDIIKSNVETDTLIKGLTEKIEALGILVQSKSEENIELKKGFDASAQFQAELAERLGMIEKQPAGRKSIVTASYIPKEFEKGGNGAGKVGEKILSISNPAQKKQLIDSLWEASGAESGTVKDEEFAKASSYLEMTGSLGGNNEAAQRIAARLKSEKQIIVIS